MSIEFIEAKVKIPIDRGEDTNVCPRGDCPHYSMAFQPTCGLYHKILYKLGTVKLERCDECLKEVKDAYSREAGQQTVRTDAPKKGATKITKAHKN